MSADNSKPSSKIRAATPAAAPRDTAKAEPKSAPKSTGRVKFDERGNAVWEWQIATGSFGLEVTTQRLQKLEHPALSIADDGTNPNGVKANPLGAKKGYDPYDSGRLAKPAPPQKKDLRKLSEWLKLKKQAMKNKEDADE
jgi:hypothetical protein